MKRRKENNWHVPWLEGGCGYCCFGRLYIMGSHPQIPIGHEKEVRYHGIQRTEFSNVSAKYSSLTYFRHEIWVIFKCFYFIIFPISSYLL